MKIVAVFHKGDPATLDRPGKEKARSGLWSEECLAECRHLMAVDDACHPSAVREADIVSMSGVAGVRPES
ncbi:hypothetical protein HFN63_35655 [Rhizobium leguminosarum]|uniref:hypothetical protein n=1 Tax=Rhizobium leguminosarum TaxID=384 RepID=UPI001C9629C3|nr:hypothetical protein [Rhizobium leguminosarum]MBY5775285.1 hypothetical protein [Rhizobium leguminosarum]